MVVAYVIGSILIAFGIAILHKIFSGSSTDLQNVYYPFTGILLLIIGAWVCYGYMAAKAHVWHLLPLYIVIPSLNSALNDWREWVEQFPSFRIATEIERIKWKQFTSLLDKKDRKMFDQMYDCVKLYNTVCMTACRLVIIHSVLMSPIFEHYKQLHQLESKIDRKEREQVTSLNDWITEVGPRDWQFNFECLLLILNKGR